MDTLFADMSIKDLAITFIILWFIWCNLPWISSKRFTLLGRYFHKRDTLTMRIYEWLIRLPIIFLLGYMFDYQTIQKPHEAYDRWEFFALFITMTLVVSLPGFIYDYNRRYAVIKRHV